MKNMLDMKKICLKNMDTDIIEGEDISLLKCIQYNREISIVGL